jgi:hypothetical protein
MTHRSLLCLPPWFLAAALFGGASHADEPPSAASSADASTGAPVPSRHQLMKDCMAKQKAAGSGKPKYELSDDCKDIIKTEKENAQANKKQADAKAAADKPTPR